MLVLRSQNASSLVGAHANEAAAAVSVTILSVEHFTSRLTSGKLIAQIWLTDLALVTSLARLLYLLGNLGTHPLKQLSSLSRNLLLKSWNHLWCVAQTPPDCIV